MGMFYGPTRAQPNSRSSTQSNSRRLSISKTAKALSLTGAGHWQFPYLRARRASSADRHACRGLSERVSESRDSLIRLGTDRKPWLKKKQCRDRQLNEPCPPPGSDGRSMGPRY